MCSRTAAARGAAVQRKSENRERSNEARAERNVHLMGLLFGVLGWVVAFVLTIGVMSIAHWSVLIAPCVLVGHAVSFWCCARVTRDRGYKWVWPYMISAWIAFVLAVGATAAYVVPDMLSNLARSR